MPSTLPSTDVVFSVSEDWLSVSMSVIFKHGTRHVVRPFESTIKAVLQTEEIATPAMAPTFEELCKHLPAQGFKGHINEQALRELSEAIHKMEKVVLRRTQAIPGTPPVLKPAPSPKGDDPIGRLRPLKTITVGAIVGYIEDGTPSSPGIDVYGRLIRAPELKASLPLFGPGLTRVHNNIIAVLSGRESDQGEWQGHYSWRRIWLYDRWRSCLRAGLEKDFRTH